MIIKISAGASSKAELLLRQLSKKDPAFAGIQFVVNQPVNRCDWWVVCHSSGLPCQEEVMCDPAHTLFISMEPPDWGCPRSFYNQFSHLISCDRSARHRNQSYRNGLTWWVGLKVKFENGHQISPVCSFDYDSLLALEPQKKKNRISVITSTGKHFSGHKKRLKFLERLSANEISKHIDFFGGYQNPVEDKMDALRGYRYHLALENSVEPDYWTEKLADPLLAWCLPVYYGCPNIESYLPRGSLVSINIQNFDLTVRALWELLESDLYERSIGQIKAAREMVLNQYNIFQLISETCNVPAGRHEVCSLRPLSFFAQHESRLDRRLIRKTRSFVGKLTRGLS
jgi:hypothetical protein